MFLFMKILLMFVIFGCHGYMNGDASNNVSLKKSRIYGPGLQTDLLLPVRYFFIQLVSKNGFNLTDSVGEGVVTATIAPLSGPRVRIWTQVLDRHDGSYVVRYRLYATISDLQISVQINGRHIAESPYQLKGDIYHDACNCPQQTSEEWAISIGCPASYPQIELDLKPFHDINMTHVAKEAVERFNERGRRSICHYKIINNKVYRKCYGEHVAFKMFIDAVVLSLARKMFLPDFEFLANIGDWPLENKALKDKPIPIMSWCGSKSSHDITMPSYDITEATLQMMGSVSLDIFSTQSNTGPKWDNKTAVAFWRGRDSCKERLQLVEMSKKYPDLIDARLTRMFFFPKDEAKYGKLTPQISFFEFFKVKQIAKNGQEFAREHLTPANILCYHVRMFQRYAKLLKRKPKGFKDFETVEQPADPSSSCSCQKTRTKKALHTEL
uniref:Glycosyl transferase CAP10 domain-containing protein n=2 Tax=Arion vulgaris TaxID=1028688 RepID=A0A0B7AME8_9EUPU